MNDDSLLRAWKPAGFTVMIKPRGAVCNLRCAHCYYLSKEGLFPGSSFIMEDDLLESFTSQYLQAQEVPEVNFVWQGGEPLLMGVDFFHKAVKLQRKYAKSGVRVLNSLQTNGTLITKEWAEFLKENRFLVGISVDGPAETHDRFRRDRAGRASHKQVIAGLRLLQEHEVEYNVLCCVSSNNAGKGLELYRYFRDDLGVHFIQFIPVVERANESGFQEGGELTRRSVTPQQYANFLISVFNEWVRDDVGKVFVQIFDTTLAAWLQQASGLCVWEPTCGLGLVLEHNGDVFSCDHYVEPEHRLGNLQQDTLESLVYSQRQHHFGMQKRDSLTAYCRRCRWLSACNGECPKNRIRRSPDGEEGHNYLCKAYQQYFAYVDKPMQVMADLIRQGQAPAGIMSLLRQKETNILPPPAGPQESQASKRIRRH